MTDLPARELLQGFVAEAWDVLAGLEEAREGLRTPHAPQALGMLRVLAHRLKGSAALYGLGETSALGGLVEDTLRGADGSPWRGDDPRLAFLDDALRELQATFDGLGRDWRERQGWSTALVARHARLFGGDLPNDAGAGGSEGALALELRRFARQNAAVMEYFGPEAEENIEAAAGGLDLLRQEPGRRDAVLATFRAVHTLKGAASTVGCHPLAELAHVLEDVLVLLRDGRVAVERLVLGLLSDGVDLLRAFQRATTGPAAADLEQRYAELRAALERAKSAGAAPAASASASAASASAASTASASASAASASDGASEHGGELEPGEAAAEAEAEELDGETFRGGLGDGARDGGRAATIRVPVGRVDGLMDLVGDMVLARGRVDRALSRLLGLERLMTDSRSLLDRAVGDFKERYLHPRVALHDGAAARGELADGAALAAGPRAEENLPAGFTLGTTFGELEFDRYDDFNVLARRLDELSQDFAEVEGELGHELRLLRLETERLDRLVRSVRGGLARVRTVPLAQLFARASRAARQAAEQLGKRIEIVLAGETVEIDTAIAEQISDPLLHLVRNAVSHGIEGEDLRRERGKPAAGKIALRAFAAGRSIAIEIEDDGEGIDVEALKRQAVALGLRTRAQTEAYSAAQALELVYLPGLTTSTEVTSTSGRGIGMDVVRTNLLRIGGEVQIESELGRGSRFRLKAPLTLAVSEAALVRVGTTVYAIQAGLVDSMVLLPRAELRPAEPLGRGGDFLLSAPAEEIDCVRVDRALGLEVAELPREVPLVLARVGGRRLGLIVDEMLGVEEVVLKSLGGFLEEMPHFAGATVSGQGELRLVLNPPAFAPEQAHLRISSEALERGWLSGGAAPLPPAAATEWASVLLVDDSVSVRKVLGGQLAAAGLAVTAVSDGAEALDRLRGASFDAVVTDLEMPRLNGYELIEEIRRRPATRDLPVLVITTRVGAKHHALARQLGVSAYFAKPVDETQLISRLRAAIHLREELQSAAGRPVATVTG